MALVLLLARAGATTVGAWCAGRAVVALRVGEPDTWWRGPIPMLLGAVGNVVLVLMAAPLTGTTPGKALAGLEIIAGDGRPPGGTRLWRRFLVQAAGPLLLVAGLVTVRAGLLVAGTAVAALTVAGSVAALLPAGRTLHDLAGGTRIRRRDQVSGGTGTGRPCSSM